MNRTHHVPGGFAEPYARYRRSAYTAPAPRSWAIETAIGDLERALCRDRCHAVIESPPGSTRALLLRALAERLRGTYRVVQLPGSVQDGELCARILAALGEPPGRDAEVRLLSVLYEIGSRGSALVVLLDDAASLPPSSLRQLGRLASVARPDLRLGLVVTSRQGSDAASRVVGALGVSAEKVSVAPRAERSLAPKRQASPVPPATPPAAAERRPPEKPIQVRPFDGGGASRRRRGALLLGLALALLGLHQLSQPLPPEPARATAAPRSVSAAPAASPSDAPPALSAAPPALPDAPPALPEAPLAPLPSGPVEGVRVTPPAGSAVAEEMAPAPPAEATPVVAPAPILVSLNARPWARIEVDGREVGVTPMADLPIAPGLHRFRAHLADGRVVERMARIDQHRDHLAFP